MLIDSFDNLPILAFTETFLVKSDSNVLCPRKNVYSIFRTDRAPGRKGGGVCLMIPKKENSGLASLSCSNNNVACDEFESVWCKLVSSKESIKLGLIYRRPKYYPTMPKKLIDHVESCLEPNVPTIILGDFNYREIDWKNLSAPNLSGMNKFLRFMTSNGFEQIVDIPTRGNAILDLIFVNSPNLVQCVKLGQKVSYLAANNELVECDHETVCAKIPFQRIKSKTSTVTNYSNANYEIINQFFLHQNWKELFATKNIEDSWSLFLSKVSEAVEAYVPTHTRKSSNFKKYPPKVSRLCRKAYKLHGNFKKSGCPITYQQYLNCSKNAQKEKRRFDFKKEKSILEKRNDPVFWSFLRNNLTYKSEIPCLIEGDSIVCDSKEKAKLFNQKFASVFINDDGNLPNWDIDPPTEFLSFVSFPPEEIYAQLKLLKNKLSCGLDGIPPYLKKMCTNSS